MNISFETKFNLGDTVYSVTPDNLSVFSFVVRKIVYLMTDKNEISVKYIGSSPFNINFNCYEANESVTFGTSEEVLEYVKERLEENVKLRIKEITGELHYLHTKSTEKGE